MIGCVLQMSLCALWLFRSRTEVMKERGQRVDLFQISDWSILTEPVFSLVATSSSLTPSIKVKLYYLEDMFHLCDPSNNFVISSLITFTVIVTRLVPWRTVHSWLLEDSSWMKVVGVVVDSRLVSWSKSRILNSIEISIVFNPKNIKKLCKNICSCHFL